MKQQPSREELLLDSAVDAARHETSDGIDAMRARVVFRQIETELHRPKKALLPVVVFGSLAGAAIAALFVFLLAPVDRTEAIVEQPLAQVVYRSGEVPTDNTEIAATARVDVAADARLDFVVPKKVRVAVYGPASVARKNDGSIALSSGRASFAVDPHPKEAPFKVRARDAEIVVHGTKFDVEVKDGLLAQVRVDEGKVEVRPADGSPSVFLIGGTALHQDVSTSTAAIFDAPWWKSRREETAEGYLSVESMPSGAEVKLGGERIGRTPLLVLWPHGDHELEISHGGYRSHVAPVAITRGAIQRISVTLDVLPRETVEVEVETPKPVAEKNLWKLARSLLEAKKCARLDRVIEELIEKSTTDTDKARAEMLGAECQLRSGAKARARGSYAHIYEAYASTQSAEAALFEVAKLEAELGRPAISLEAIELYLSRHANGRFAEAAMMRRCELLLELKHLGEARGCLENYRRTFPKAIRGPQAVLLLATIARVEARFAAAAELYRDYLQLSPDATRAEDALYHRIACMKRGNIAGVEVEIAEFLSRFPNSTKREEVAKWKR